jgi:beta-1,4-mannosyl-glycoprotein beta-1,4-N-acetylglucosaminyltransferase
MLIDCFTFYNEIDILTKRLRYLSPVVDKFILVESTVTHRGEDKELIYENNKHLFEEWNDKIIHIIVRDNPIDINPWSRENFQRNCITRGLEGIPDDALVMISDVDEIPNKDFIELPEGVHTCTFNMIAFEYSLKYMQEIEPWFGTVLTTRKILRHVTPQIFRDRRWKFPFYKNSGWHLSSFGDEEFVANKIYNYSHCFDESAKHKDIDTFKSLIQNGIHADGKHKLTLTTEEILRSVPDELK